MRTEPAEHTFRQIVEAAPNALVLVDETGEIRYVNRQAELLFRCSREQLVGRRADTLVPERQRPSLPGLLEQARAADGPGAIGGAELCGLRSDGGEFPVEVRLNSMETDDGRLVLAAVVDVTARQREERRFRTAIESAPSGMIMADAAGRIVLVNSQTERLFGYGRDELVGRSVEMLVPERFRGEHPQARAEFQTTPEARPMGAGRDLHGRRKDGTEFPVEIGLNPIETSEGVFTLSAIVDISERKRLEGELHQKLDELASADRRKDEFLAMLAHELRNPLAPMRNAVQLLKMPALDPASATQVREMMERQLHQMVRLVDDLLEVSRIVSGRIELRRAPIDVADAVARGIETAQPVLDARGHVLETRLHEQPLFVDADLVRISQVVANLLTNAAKYSPEAGRIWLRVEREGQQVLVRVRDQGIGIAAELLPQIFDLFVRGDSPLGRAQGGLGLGLTLVKRVVAMHGGSVAASSGGVGQGSEFAVRLPLVDAPAGTPPGPTFSSLPPRAGEALRTRVLVVDDNVDAAESIALVLKLAGYVVHCAYDGGSALRAAETYAPDVVVLDIGLPDITGYEVARRLRAQPRFSHVPLVAVTGYGQEADRRQSREAGIDEHLTKPVDPQTLQAVIAAAETRH